MKTFVTSLLILTAVSLCASNVAAQECRQFVIDERARPAEDAEFAAAIVKTAHTAREAGCLEQADRLFEGAFRLSPAPPLIYERILVREAMGDIEYAHELLKAYRPELAGDPTITDLVEVDARLRARLRDPAGTMLTEPSQPVPSSRSTLDTVGPIALAGIGVLSLGLAVYGLTASCELVASDGQCLRGSEVRQTPTIAYGTAGVIALTSAAVWWILAIPVPVQASLTPAGVLVRF